MDENPMLMDQQNQYCGNGYTIKSKLNVQWSPYQNSKTFFTSDRKINPEVHVRG
jgi:hypothetical protein